MLSESYFLNYPLYEGNFNDAEKYSQRERQDKDNTPPRLILWPINMCKRRCLNYAYPPRQHHRSVREHNSSGNAQAALSEPVTHNCHIVLTASRKKDILPAPRSLVAKMYGSPFLVPLF